MLSLKELVQITLRLEIGDPNPDSPLLVVLVEDASAQLSSTATIHLHPHVLNTALATCYPVVEQATQAGPSPPLHPFQCYESPGRSELRTEIIDQFHDLLAMYVHGDSVALHDLADDLLSGKKWSNTFGGPGKKQDGKADSKFLSSLVEEYQECKRKETNSLIQKQSQKLKQAINISRTLSNSQIAFQGNTAQNFNTRIDAAYSLGRLTTYSAERWGVLSIVAADYP